MDIDIYADLDFDLGKKFVELEKKNEELTQEINKLEGTVNVLNEEVSQIKEVNELLKINISELYKTALAELQRKNRALAETRKELDELIVRRTKQETNYDKNEYQSLLIEFKKKCAQAIEKDKEISILKGKLESESKKLEELKRKNESSSNGSGYKRGYVDEDSDERALKRSRYGRSDEKLNHDEYKDYRNRHNSKDYQDDRYPNRDYRRYHFNSRFRSKRRFHENDRGFHKRRYESHKNRYDNFDSQRNEDYYNERAPIEDNTEHCDNTDEGNIDLQRKYPSDFNSQKLSRLKENSRNDEKNSEWKLNLIEGNTTRDGPKFLEQTEDTRIESNQSQTTKEEIFKKYGLPPPPDLKPNKSDLSVITEYIQSEIEQAKLNRTDKVVKDVVKTSTEILENFDPNLSFELTNEIQKLAAENHSDKKTNLQENKPHFAHPKKVLQDKIFKLAQRKSVTENKNEIQASEKIPPKEKESNTLLTEQVKKNWTDVADLKIFKIPKRRKSTLETITELCEDNTVTNETSELEFQYHPSVDASKTFEKVNNFEEVNDLDKINVESKIKKAERNDFMRNWLKKGTTTKQENSSKSGKDMEKLQELYNVNDLDKSFEEETITLNYAYEMEEGEVLDSPVKGNETIQITSENVYIETVTMKENVIQPIKHENIDTEMLEKVKKSLDLETKMSSERKSVEVPLKSSSKKEIILKRSATKVESIPEKEIIPEEKHKAILTKPTAPVELKNIEPDVNLNIIEETPKRPKQSPNTKFKKNFERKTNKCDIKDKSQKHPKLKIVRLKTDKVSNKNKKHNYRVLDITETVENTDAVRSELIESAKLHEDYGYLSSSQKEKEAVEKIVEMRQERKEIKQHGELNKEREEKYQNCEEKYQNCEEKNQKREEKNEEREKMNEEREEINQEREEINQKREEKNQERENINQEREEINQKCKEANQERKETYKILEETSSKLKETHHGKLEEKHSKREKTYRKHEKTNPKDEKTYSKSEKTHSKLDQKHSEHEKSHSKLDEKHSEHEKSHSKPDKKHSEHEKLHSKLDNKHSEREKTYSKLAKTHPKLDKTHSESEKTHSECERSHSKRERTDSEHQKTISKHKTHLESENTHSKVKKINRGVKKSNAKLQETHEIRKGRRPKRKETNEKLEKPSQKYDEINQQIEERNQQIEERNQQLEERNQQLEGRNQQIEKYNHENDERNQENEEIRHFQADIQLEEAVKSILSKSAEKQHLETDKMFTTGDIFQQNNTSKHKINILKVEEIDESNKIDVQKILKQVKHSDDNTITLFSNSEIATFEIETEDTIKINEALRDYNEKKRLDLHAISDSDDNIDIVGNKKKKFGKNLPTLYEGSLDDEKSSNIEIVRSKSAEMAKSNTEISLQINQPQKLSGVNRRKSKEPTKINRIVDGTVCVSPTRTYLERNLNKIFEETPRKKSENKPEIDKNNEKTQMQQGRRIEDILSKKRKIFESSFKDTLQCKHSSEHEQTEEEGPPLKMRKDRDPETQEFLRNESREDDMKNIDVEADQRRKHTLEDIVASNRISGVTIVPTENLDISQRGLHENTQKMDEGVIIAPLTVEFPKCFDDNPTGINDFSNTFKIQVNPEDLAQNTCDTGKRFKRPVNPRRKISLVKHTKPPQQADKLTEKNTLTVEQQTMSNQPPKDTSKVFEEATQKVSKLFEETTQSSQNSARKEKPVTKSISPQKEVVTTTELSTSDTQKETSEKIGEDLEPLPKPKRGRGRPRKIIQANEKPQKASSGNNPGKFKRVTRSQAKNDVIPKKRGRKKKEVEVQQEEKLELKKTPKKNTQVVLPENDSPGSNSSSTDAAESSDSSCNSSCSRSSSSSSSSSVCSSSATESARENSPLIRMMKSPGRPLQKTPVRGTKSPVHPTNPTFTSVKSPLRTTQITLSPKNPILHTTNIPISSETSSVVVQFLPLSRNSQVLEPTISPLPVVLLNTISPKQYPSFLISPSSALNPTTNSPILNSTSPLSVTRGRQPTIVKKDLLLHTTRALDFSISSTRASSAKPKLSSPKNTTPEENSSSTPKFPSIKEMSLVLKQTKVAEKNAVQPEKDEIQSTSHTGSTITSKIDTKTLQAVAEKSKVTSTSKSQGTATILEAASKATSPHMPTSSSSITATTSPTNAKVSLGMAVMSQGVATTSKATVSIHQASKTTDATKFKEYEEVAKQSEGAATTSQASTTASRNTADISESAVETSKENTSTSRTTASSSKAVAKSSHGASTTTQGVETPSKTSLTTSRTITSISEAVVKTSNEVSTTSKETTTYQPAETPSQAAETTEKCETTSSATKRSAESTQSKSNPTTSKAIETTSSTSKVLSQVVTTRYETTTSTQINPIKSQEISPELKSSTTSQRSGATLNTDQISGGSGTISRVDQENQTTSQLTVTTSKASPVKSGTISTTSQVISTTSQLITSTSQTTTTSEVNLTTSGESAKTSQTTSQSSETASNALATGGAPQTTTNPAPPAVKPRRRRCVITIS